MMDGSILPDSSPPPSGCGGGEALIYVIDRTNSLSQFNPRELSFSEPRAISCASDSIKPFSMSVDQSGTAWVLFRDSARPTETWLDTVNTTTGECGGMRITPPEPLEYFGMGFADNGGSEALFVSGGSWLELQNVGFPGGEEMYPATLYRLDPAGPAATRSGQLTGWPELSGNSMGQLFGFFAPKSDPGSGTVIRPGRVVELDRATGTENTEYTLSAMTGDFESKYAFAFWGGRLYIFIKQYGQDGSEVWRFDLPPIGDGSVTRILTDVGRIIVGAGVSTCAPVELI